MKNPLLDDLDDKILPLGREDGDKDFINSKHHVFKGATLLGSYWFRAGSLKGYTFLVLKVHLSLTVVLIYTLLTITDAKHLVIYLLAIYRLWTNTQCCIYLFLSTN